MVDAVLEEVEAKPVVAEQASQLPVTLLEELECNICWQLMHDWNTSQFICKIAAIFMGSHSFKKWGGEQHKVTATTHQPIYDFAANILTFQFG